MNPDKLNPVLSCLFGVCLLFGFAGCATSGGNPSQPRFVKAVMKAYKNSPVGQEKTVVIEDGEDGNMDWVIFYFPGAGMGLKSPLASFDTEVGSVTLVTDNGREVRLGLFEDAWYEKQGEWKMHESFWNFFKQSEPPASSGSGESPFDSE